MRSSIRIKNLIDPKKDCTTEELFQVGLVLFASLCNNVMSPDVMYLSFAAAIERLRDSGIEEQKLEFMIKKYAELAEVSRQGNPMTKVFWS